MSEDQKAKRMSKRFLDLKKNSSTSSMKYFSSFSSFSSFFLSIATQEKKPLKVLRMKTLTIRSSCCSGRTIHWFGARSFCYLVTFQLSRTKKKNCVSCFSFFIKIEKNEEDEVRRLERKKMFLTPKIFNFHIYRAADYSSTSGCNFSPFSFWQEIH